VPEAAPRGGAKPALTGRPGRPRRTIPV